MNHRCFLGIVAVLFIGAYPVEAQHHHATFHYYHFSQPFINSPWYSAGTYWPQPVQVPVYYPVSVVPLVPSGSASSTKGISTPSTAAARMKSVEQQTRGDRFMREQKWSDAKAAFTNAVKSAPDRAGAHYRLALSNVAIKRYDAAISEFKLALILDPALPTTATKLDAICGPDGNIAVSAMISRLGEWVGEDLRSSDRLFLLGVVLFLNRDARANDAFQAALRADKTGEVSHITAFLAAAGGAGPNPGQLQPADLPPLKDQPVLPIAKPIDIDLRFPKSVVALPQGAIPGAPVPMP
jgi:tetratricopeptide (TPR) repeat protein